MCGTSPGMKVYPSSRQHTHYTWGDPTHSISVSSVLRKIMHAIKMNIQLNIDATEMTTPGLK